MEEIKVGEYVSRKEYLKKYDSNVGYALYVQSTIKRDDYARLNTGKIAKVIGIKENNINKEAIYYGVYEQDWFDASAVENFSDNIIDLIEPGDYVNGNLEVYKGRVASGTEKLLVRNSIIHGIALECINIKSVVTKEQFKQAEYKI